MRPDFSLIWGADNAPFTPIEASDYTAGWVFRTGAPPRRVNFDYFQNLSDQRTTWLGEQMLLAVGHEWQDDVSYDEYAIVRSPVDGKLYRSLVGSNLNNEPSISGSEWELGIADSTDLLNSPIATVAAAGTVDLNTGAPNTSQLAISGTGVNINGFTVAANRWFCAKAIAANTLVNSPSLVTGRGANIPLAAGDSFLMRSTAANTVEILCGNFLADAAVGSRGQAYQIFNSTTRPINTTFTNTTGRAIEVLISNNTDTLINYQVDGVTVATSLDGAQGNITTTFTVPAGSTYRGSGAGGLTNYIWAEMRV